MLFSAYAAKLSQPHEIDSASQSHLDGILRYRRVFAIHDDGVRFGMYERTLIDDAREKLMLDAEGEFAPLARLIPPAPRSIARFPKSSRDVYVDDVIPLVRCGSTSGSDDTRILPPLPPQTAHEVAFAVLEDLQARCERVALRMARDTHVGGFRVELSGINVDISEDMETSVDQFLGDAVMTAKLASALFGETVDPSMVDDWGRGTDDGPIVTTLSIPCDLVDSIRMAFRPAAQDLRLLLEEADEELGLLAMAVWSSHTALFGGPADYVPTFPPVWWMRPTYRLPRYYDAFEVSPNRLLEPFEVSGVPTEAMGEDAEEISLTMGAARGLAALCGMILARATLSDCPSYSTRYYHSLGRPIDLVSLSGLHKKLLVALGLL